MTNAPRSVTEPLFESSGRLATQNEEVLRKRIAELEGRPIPLTEWQQMEQAVATLHQICRDAYEVWAGSESIPEPETAAEAYLYQLLIAMRDEVKRGLK